MMKYFVNGFCRINNRKVTVNDILIYEDHQSSFDDFLLKIYPLGEIYTKYYKMDNLSKAGVIASELLLQNENPNQKYKPEDIAVVLSNHSSSLDTDLRYQKSTEKIPSPALFVYTLPNIVIGEICIRNKFKGENAFFIHEAFDPEYMVKYVDLLLQNNQTEACLSGWVEVLGENHDVFLYLVEKKKSDYSFNHSMEDLLKKYNNY